MRAVLNFAREFATARIFRARIGHVMQMAVNSSAQDFKDSSSVGTGEAHVFNTEGVLLSNERLERSSPVLWPDSATLCEYCQLRSSPKGKW